VNIHFNIIPSIVVAALKRNKLIITYNIFPSTGNIRRGASIAAGTSDVYKVYYISKHKVLENSMPTASVEFLNPITSSSDGKKNYMLTENSPKEIIVSMYIATRSPVRYPLRRTNTITDILDSMGCGLNFTHSESTDNPGYWGFYQTVQPRTNRNTGQIFQERLLMGCQFNVTSRSVCTADNNYWMFSTNSVGN